MYIYNNIKRKSYLHTYTYIHISRACVFINATVESEKIFLQRASLWRIYGGGGEETCRRLAPGLQPPLYYNNCRRRRGRRHLRCRCGCCSDGRLFSEQLGLVFSAASTTRPGTIDPWPLRVTLLPIIRIVI